MKESVQCGVSTSIFGHRDALTPGKLETLAVTGIETIEIAALQDMHVNLWDEETAHELLRYLSGSPLKVWSVHAPFCGFCMDDADTRADGVRRMVRTAVWAERFGAECIVVHPGRDVPGVDSDREFRWAVDYIKRALDIMPERIVVALETMERDALGGPPEEMLRLMEQLPAERVGICLDTGHVNLGFDVAHYIEAMSGRIVSVHLQDNNGRADDHLLAGDGQIDWPDTLAALRCAGYSGVLMSEGKNPALSVEENAGIFAGRMNEFSGA